MKVECEIEHLELENDNGYLIPGTTATCGDCNHQTESFGESEASVKRCLVLLHEECPKGRNNFYVGED